MIYLGIITQNNEEDIKEICSLIHYIDGIFGVVHYPCTDKTFEILDANKSGGEIIKLPYYQRHDWSMNGFLFNPKLMRGSWVLLCDSLERYAEPFLADIRNFTRLLDSENIEYVYQYSKLMMFKKKDEHFFFGSPHWGLANRQGKSICIENHLPDDKVRYSVRNQKRNKDEYVRHFMVYYLHAGMSNHLLLGRENNIQEYQAHEDVRRKFLSYLTESLKIELTVDAIKNHIIKNGLNYELKWFFNWEEILNTWYCYEILGHSFEDVDARRNKNELFKIC